MDLRWMTTVDADAVMAASHLFDYDARSQWTERFLAQPDHHLGIAYVDGAPAGFVSGVEVTHPDKGLRCFSTNSPSMSSLSDEASVTHS